MSESGDDALVDTLADLFPDPVFLGVSPIFTGEPSSFAGAAKQKLCDRAGDMLLFDILMSAN